MAASSGIGMKTFMRPPKPNARKMKVCATQRLMCKSLLDLEEVAAAVVDIVHLQFT
jgi:hypothetical protein